MERCRDDVQLLYALPNRQVFGNGGVPGMGKMESITAAYRKGTTLEMALESYLRAIRSKGATMKFHLETTCSTYSAEWPPFNPGEVGVRKLQAIGFGFRQDERSDHLDEWSIVSWPDIEISSMEELVAFRQKLGLEIILTDEPEPTLEILDSYRE